MLISLSRTDWIRQQSKGKECSARAEHRMIQHEQILQCGAPLVDAHWDRRQLVPPIILLLGGFCKLILHEQGVISG